MQVKMKSKNYAYVIEKQEKPKEVILSINEQMELFAEIIVDIYLESNEKTNITAK